MTVVTGPVDVVKQFIANFERKQRNLMKRKGKLDAYREQLNRGEALNEEQKKAVDGYEGVLQSLNVVQEVLTQSKDLVSDVEKCCKIDEAQQEVEHERYTVSFLHTHVCLLRLLGSLDQHDVRVAVTKASSENSLKLLDAVRRLLLPPLPDNWPHTVSGASSNSPPLIEVTPEVDVAAQHSLHLVLGRPVPIPIPDDYTGPHKKLNFKEARNLCFRLLSTPAVRRTLERSTQSDFLASHVQDEALALTRETLNTPEALQPNPEIMVHVDGFQVPDNGAVPAKPSPSSNRRFDPPSAPNVLDQVIKPLGGTFNFLQASSVMASDPLTEISASRVEVPVGPQLEHNLPDATESHMPVSNSCYSQPSPPAASEAIFIAEPDNELPVPTENISRESDNLRQMERSQVIVEPDVPVKPISYADLVRRSGFNRPTHQQEHYLSGPAHESRKTESVVPETHNVHDSGDAENGHHGPSWNRGGRGFNRGFSRGPPRRAVGGARYGRIAAGAGRGGGGPYRGAPQSVAQPSY